MSVCACIKITMACFGQNADDSAVSAISTGVWVVPAAVALREGPRHGCALGKPSLSVLWANLPFPVASRTIVDIFTPDEG